MVQRGVKNGLLLTQEVPEVPEVPIISIRDRSKCTALTTSSVTRPLHPNVRLYRPHMPTVIVPAVRKNSWCAALLLI